MVCRSFCSVLNSLAATKRIRVTLEPLASTVPEFNAVRTLPVYENLQGVPGQVEKR
jgi:hypothetical protein